MSVKHTLGLPFPNLPFLIQTNPDGSILRLTQSNSIVRHLGRLAGLCGKTETEAALVDMLLEQLMDFRNSIVRVAYRPLADYGDVLSAAASDVFPSHLRGFEAFIGSEDWLVGSAGLTVADIVLYELADQVRLMAPGLLIGFPKVAAMLGRFEALPKIAEYQASTRFLRRPINNTSASFL